MKKNYLFEVETDGIFIRSKNRILIFLLLFFNFGQAYSQCAYTGSPLTKAGTDIIFCIDNNTTTSSSVSAGQYVVLNVVKGFKYTFSVADVFPSENENLTLFKEADNSNLGSFGTGANGATITGWTATLSGKIKILLSKGNCINDNTSGGVLTLTLIGIGNTQDLQSSFETDQWIGHVYNWVPGSTPPGGTSPNSLPNSTPFNSENYVGYYKPVIAAGGPTDMIDENFGGNAVCFPVLSDGANGVNVLTETFAVRYRMRSTKKGCYFLNVSGDDGIRVYVDGALVFNAWRQQGPTNYCNNLIYLSGKSVIVFDYYENSGQNIAKLSLTAFDPTTNSTVAGTRTVCSGSSPGLLDGSSYASCAVALSSNVLFQWQISSDGLNFTDIATATLEDYTPATITTNTNDVKYYRRVLKAVGSNAESGVFYTNVIQVNTSAGAVGGAVASAQSICSGSSPLNLTLSGHTGSVLRWEKSNDSTFGSGVTVITNTTTSLSPGILTSSTYFRAVVKSGNCSEINSASVLITVNPNVAASVTISASSSIICVGAGTSLTFTAAPTNGGASPSYQWQVNDVNAGLNSPTFTSTTLAVGDKVKVKMSSNASPCLTASPVLSNEITIAVQTTVYNGGWSTTPAPNLSAQIISSYNLSANLQACSLSIINNSSVTIKSGDNFTLQNGITIAEGSILKIESGANLIQINNLAVNSGNVIAEREFKINETRLQYNYLGTPVAFQSGESYRTIFSGSTNTTVLYHNQVTNRFVTSSGANVPGRGSAVKEPPTSTLLTAGKTTAQFKGVPQNGEIILSVANSNINVASFGYNLMGNPYVSNIDLIKLYTLNGGDIQKNISSTFYFWDNTGNTIFTQQGSGYSGQSYALFNVLAGSNGTGTAAGSVTGGKIPTNIAKVGQGFMTRSLQTGYNFKFNNSVRTSETSAVDFLGKGNFNVQDDRYWLKMTAPSGIISTLAVVHYPGGGNLYGAEDSRSMGGSDALYSIVENEKLGINGRSSFAESDIIPLGSDHFVGGYYQISIDVAEGIFNNGQDIYLKDKQTGIMTNLSQGSYTFAANSGESTGRFEIIYRPETVLATNDPAKNQIIVYRDATDVMIKSPNIISNVKIYDLSGKLIMDLIPNSKLARIDVLMVPGGVYILKIETKEGEIVSRKFIR